MTARLNFECIAVIGSGTMGSGIAQVIATAGLNVTLVDRTQQDLDRGRSIIEQSLGRIISKGALSEADAVAVQDRIHPTLDYESIENSQAVIEAVFEEQSAKRDVLQAIDQHAPAAKFVATNTSSISITALAAGSSRPERVVGMHFFNPVPVLPLVEIIRALQSSSEAVESARSLAEQIGKQPVVVNDSPGFVANRILIPMINEAVGLLELGVAARDDIDAVMRLGANHPIGPLALADLIGLDICLAILDVLHRDLGDDKYRPSPLLRRMVDAGQLGRKKGRGFYVYN
jgi:3-hydroxybutyryl-CoA dehydrogenase